MMPGIVALLAILIVVALVRATNDALSLWWARRQPPAPRPSGGERKRVWCMDCDWTDRKLAHPSHKWRRSARASGDRPTSHPNWCPGFACPALHRRPGRDTVWLRTWASPRSARLRGWHSCFDPAVLPTR